MSAEWWAAKLRQGNQQPPQYQPPPQSYAPAPPQYPYPQPQQYNPPPGNYPQVPQHYQQPTQPDVNQHAMSEAQVMEMVRSGQVDKMTALAMAAQKGGKASKMETENCPNCGSGHYFQRKAQSKRGAAPAPYCHTCGYNGGMFEQFGTQDA